LGLLRFLVCQRTYFTEEDLSLLLSSELVNAVTSYIPFLDNKKNNIYTENVIGE